MITVKTLKELNGLLNHKENEVVLVEETDTKYTFKNGEWIEYNNPEFVFNLYDINCQYYNKQPNLSNDDIKNCAKAISEYCAKNGNPYFMLLNNEQHYYTLFNIKSNVNCKIANELYTLLSEFDGIKAYEFNEVTNAYEIWAELNGEIGMFVFFDYTQGVIECQL